MNLNLKVLIVTVSLALSVSALASENIDGVKSDVDLISNFDTYKVDRVADTLSRITRIGADFKRDSRTSLTVMYTTFRMGLLDEKLLYLLKATHKELDGLAVTFYGSDKDKIQKLQVYAYLQDLGLQVNFKQGVYKCLKKDLVKISDCRLNSIQFYAARS